MYESFYRLTEHPFSLTPDSDFLFLNQNFQKALDQIAYAVDRREAFSVLIGDVGTGKTTLCWALIQRMPQNTRTALILNPLLDIDDLLRAIIQDFKIEPRRRREQWHTQSAPEAAGLRDASWLDGLSRKQLIDELNRFLLDGAADDIRNIVFIDEAQNLSPECLEQLRVLSNLETSKRKLLQIIFSGQLELDQKLNLPQLRQLKQRISVRCFLQPLSRADTTRYIHHRLGRAGSNRTLSFSKSAYGSIHKHSQGYPRLINIICDRALMAGYKERSRIITNKIAKTAIGSLGVSKTKTASKPLPFSVKLAGISIMCLMILAGIAYYFLTPGNYGGSVVHRETIQPATDDADTAQPEITPELQAPAAAQSQVPAVPVSPQPSGSEFSLQVHSLGTQQDADRAVEGFRQKGYPSYQRSITNRDGILWYVVYIGPFADLTVAEETAEIILEREKLQTILRSLPPI